MVSTRNPTFITPTLQIEAWADPVIDQHGVDPRSGYVEQVWLGVLGPTTVWLLRRLVSGLDTEPSGFELDLADTAAAMGLGGAGKNSPFMRSISRACQFGMARALDAQTLAVRRRLPPATQHQLKKLPPSVRTAHDAWMQTRVDRHAHAHYADRALQLATTLVEIGESLDEVETQLRRWRFHPALAHDVAHRAWSVKHEPSSEPASRPVPNPDSRPSVPTVSPPPMPE